VRWGKCPVKKSNYCTGKEKIPTLAFQCVVDHDKRVLLVSKVFWGAANDKEILRNVPETQQFLLEKYNNINYTLYDKYGRERYMRGAYMICDGGFLKLGEFMDPSIQKWGLAEVGWSEYLESIRKDVECFFGIIKSRFRILHNALQLHSEHSIECCFKTACVLLHNMILAYDKGVQKAME
jgi:hypothetical protein